MDIIAMIRVCINGIASAVMIPGMNTGFILFLLIIYFQYKKNTAMQEAVYGRPKTTLSNLIITSVVSGIISGIVVSIPMTLLGVTFSSNMGLQYLIVISLLLMLIEPRFLCFSYSGGILCTAALLLGLTSIDVTGIMLLIAVLHLLEAILIFFDGHRGAVPVFLERDDGSIVGGFTMQRYWPIPLALILYVGFGTPSGDVISTPEWWPLIKPYINSSIKIKQALFTVAPVAAILGYSEFTSSYIPREKCKTSALRLTAFSLILFILAALSSYIYIFKFIAALFAPIAHEAIILYEKRIEKVKKPLFTPVRFGVRVLDTIPGSVAEKMGMMPGDVIVSINNRRVVTEEGLGEFLNTYPPYIWVDLVDKDGRERTVEHRDYRDGINNLGIISVPKTKNGIITVKERKSYVSKLFNKYLKR